MKWKGHNDTVAVNTQSMGSVKTQKERRSREKEIERNLFFKGLLRMLEREKSRIYVISDAAEKAESLIASAESSAENLSTVTETRANDALESADSRELRRGEDAKDAF